MRTPLSWLGAAVTATLLSATYALAIINGEPAGDDYQYVGYQMIVFPAGQKPDGLEYQVRCSGSLIAGRYNSRVGKPVFLTAGHCARSILNYLAEKDLPRSSFWVSFDRYATEDEQHPNPNDPDGFNYPRIQVGESESDIEFYLSCYTTGPCGVNEADLDIAVLLLEPDTLQGGALPEPAKLATLNLLDDLRAQRALRGQRLTTVGYGITSYFATGAYEWEAERYVAQETYLALGPGYLIASMNASTGNGGSCFGDSGGPILLPDPNNDPDVPDTIVSIVSMGDAVCRALDQSYRVDTPFAYEFLRRFVDVVEP